MLFRCTVCTPKFIKFRMTKVIFFDIDGTLLDRDGKFNPGTLYSLDKLKEKGIKCVVASGRHMIEIDDLPIKDYPFDGYVLLNGQIILDENKNIIYDHSLNENDMTILKEMFINKVLPIVFVEKDRLYLNYIDDNVIKAQDSIVSTSPLIGEYMGNIVYQASVFVDKDGIRKLSKKLSHTKITSWHEYGYDLIANEGGKHNGILKILEYYNIDKNDSIAFGDGENDISMFEIVGLSIAMGDASLRVKEKADEATNTSKENGIYNALIEHGIIK